MPLLLPRGEPSHTPSVVSRPPSPPPKASKRGSESRVGEQTEGLRTGSPSAEQVLERSERDLRSGPVEISHLLRSRVLRLFLRIDGLSSSPSAISVLNREYTAKNTEPPCVYCNIILPNTPQLVILITCGNRETTTDHKCEGENLEHQYLPDIGIYFDRI